MLRVTGGPLVEFSFTSHLAESIAHAALLRMVRQAWAENLRAGVTGYLRLEGTGLDQTIEGSSATILALSARILVDPRHGRIAVRSFRPIAERRFAAWSVEGLEPSAANAPDPGTSPGVLRLLTRADLPPLGAKAAQPLTLARAT